MKNNKNNNSSKCPTKEVLTKLYITEKKSTRDIAEIYDVNKDTASRWLSKNGIPRRSTSESTLISSNRYSGKVYSTMTLEEIIESIGRKIEPVKYTHTTRDNIFIPLPLKVIDNIGQKKLDTTLTITLSDLHLGNEDHLPDTYWSTINNLKKTLLVIKNKFNIKKINIVCNGDIVSGTDVYRFQELNNLVQRGHWMVFLAERIIKKTIDEIETIVPINKIYLIKGNHEARRENYTLYLKKTLGDKATYSSKELILDIGDPIGHYNILCTHGSGSNEYFSVSLTVIRDLWKLLSNYKNQNIIIERAVLSHTHWLTTDIPTEGVNLSICGGFQRWNRSLSQRPCGLLVLMYCDNECSVIPIRPNEDVEQKEKSEPALEYKNMAYYANVLREHYMLYEKDNQGAN